MSAFERVTYQTEHVVGGKADRRTVILQDPHVVNIDILCPVLIGIGVDRDGTIAEPQITYAIGTDTIIKRVRLVEDLHYGGLVAWNKESPQSKKFREGS